jgi:hypothetical protein
MIHSEVGRASGLTLSQREYRVLPCSARRDEGLAVAFDWLVQAAKAHLQPAQADESVRFGIC